MEIETFRHGEILKLDLRNFLNEPCRGMIVDGAELADPLFALYGAGLYGEETTYVHDPANADARHFFDTRWGTVQGDVLSARLASLAILPAQRKFFSILRKNIFKRSSQPGHHRKIKKRLPNYVLTAFHLRIKKSYMNSFLLCLTWKRFCEMNVNILGRIRTVYNPNTSTSIFELL